MSAIKPSEIVIRHFFENRLITGRLPLTEKISDRIGAVELVTLGYYRHTSMAWDAHRKMHILTFSEYENEEDREAIQKVKDELQTCGFTVTDSGLKEPE